MLHLYTVRDSSYLDQSFSMMAEYSCYPEALSSTKTLSNEGTTKNSDVGKETLHTMWFAVLLFSVDLILIVDRNPVCHWYAW